MTKFTILLLSLILLLFTACGSKAPFVKQEPLADSALVYVYLPSNISDDENQNESDYNIRFNGRQVMERISSGEYMAFNVKPERVEVSVVRKQIEEKSIVLDLKVGQTYYLKIEDNLDGNNFDFVRMNKRDAYPELMKTGLAGSSNESEENIINVFTDEPKQEESVVVAPVSAQATPQVAPIANTSSKMDDIQKAYDMKEKGMLSEEEFKTIKAEILAK